MKAYLELSEIDLMEKAAKCQRNRLLIRLLFHLGCRVSEALAITADDIDFGAGIVTIEHLKKRMKLSYPHCHSRLGSSHTYCPKCGAMVEQVVAEEREHRRQRMLPLDEDTLAMLKEYVACGGTIQRRDKRLIFGINRHRAWQIVKECAEKSGLPKVTNQETGRVHNVSPHRLRDAFAVHAMKVDDSGNGLRLLQEHLGHLSFNTTARYRKIAGEEHRQWYDSLWHNRTC